MDVKEAITKAKAYVTDVYADAHISELELEETEFDRTLQQWRIGLSFSIPAPQDLSAGPSMQTALELVIRAANRGKKRLHKVITITESGEVLAMKDRAWMESAE